MIVEPAPPATPVKLDAKLTVFVTDEEKAEVKRDAAAAGVSMSALGRQRITNG